MLHNECVRTCIRLSNRGYWASIIWGSTIIYSDSFNTAKQYWTFCQNQLSCWIIGWSDHRLRLTLSVDRNNADIVVNEDRDWIEIRHQRGRFQKFLSTIQRLFKCWRYLTDRERDPSLFKKPPHTQALDGYRPTILRPVQRFEDTPVDLEIGFFAISGKKLTKGDNQPSQGHRNRRLVHSLMILPRNGFNSASCKQQFRKPQGDLWENGDDKSSHAHQDKKWCGI